MGLAAMRQIRDTGGLGMNTAKAEMRTTWKTKYGPRRVRHDPPTLEEAIFAARGLTDDV